MDSKDDDRLATSELAARFMRVFDSSFKLMSQRRHHNHIFKDLSINQLHMLNMLYRHPGTAQKELAELLEITPPAVSTAIRAMEAMGLVERKADENDARLMRLFLSEDANQIVGENLSHRHAAIAKLLSVLPIEEQHMVVSSLEKALLIYTNHDNPTSEPYSDKCTE
ncbi:MAG: MarR family transcriptional regulator [Anaerolineaceae bacterium]|nr:MarR family transcriptional regulator [Anaerolineaceae bacterium]